MQRTLSLFILAIAVAISNVHAGQGDIGFIPVTGGKLYYEKFGDRSDTPIIVLHGGPGMDSSYLLPQMAELAEANEVIFYDQRGCGKSQGFVIDEANINMNTYVDDLEAVRKNLGSAKVILVGHSWGTMLGLSYALKYPNNVKSLVLVSSFPSSAAGFNIYAAQYYKRLKPIQGTLDHIANSNAFKAGDTSVIKQYYYEIFSVYFYNKADENKLTLNFTKQAALNGFKIAEIFSKDFNSFDLTVQLKSLNMPVLLVHGKEDIIPLETAVMTQEAIPGAKLSVIERCAHFPYIERPKEFFAVTNAFILNAG